MARTVLSGGDCVPSRPVSLEAGRSGRRSPRQPEAYQAAKNVTSPAPPNSPQPWPVCRQDHLRPLVACSPAIPIRLRSDGSGSVTLTCCCCSCCCWRTCIFNALMNLPAIGNQRAPNFYPLQCRLFGGRGLPTRTPDQPASPTVYDPSPMPMPMPMPCLLSSPSTRARRGSMAPAYRGYRTRCHDDTVVDYEQLQA